MRHRKKGRKLSRTSAHKKALMANLACSLIEHGHITTTLAKSKELRVFVESLVSSSLKDDLQSRRHVLAALHSKEAVTKLFGEVAPQFKDRTGGYTRILKLGRRYGDAAEMARIEFVT
jgi:large subunit ribosomal protein L17